MQNKKVGDNMTTTKTNNIILNTFDDKRFYVNNIKSYPHDENLYLFKRDLVNKINNTTLAALDSKTNASKNLGHHQQSTFLDGRAALLTPTPDPPVTSKDDRGETFAVNNNMIDTLLEMCKQTNKQFQLISVDPNSNNFKLNGVK